MEKKIEQIDIGDTEWELNEMLRKYRPEVIAKILDKIVEIVDCLNTQPQAEEKTKLVMPPSAYEQAEKEGFNMKNKVKSELLPKSTPEQKEEWEERFAEFFLYVTNDKNWVDGRPEWKGDVFVTLYNAILHFIENLLEEREREVFTKDELFMLKLATNDIHNKGNGAYDEIGKKIERMLSKLTTK